jgi:hypothetical protein
MKINLITILLLVSIFYGCNNGNNNTSQSPYERKLDSVQQTPIEMVGVRSERYCEVLTITGSMNNLVATVYNTVGCNDCPENVWKNIDQEKIKKDFKAKSVIMNGPRVFLMDSIGQFNTPPPKINLGGIEMIERAKLNIDIKSFLKGKHKPYDEQEVNRSTKYVFNQGSNAYFLHNNGSTYIMQSFAQIINPKLKEEGLKTLANSLKLPNGWTYEAKRLDETIILETKEGGEAYIIQDDFQNSYQKIKQ